jgi:ribosomal protein S18 acetylase RimI-like enzyme
MGDMEAVVSNYYSYFDELAENPWLGILVSGDKPSLSDEAKWFADLYASILDGDCVAFVAVVDGSVVGLCEVRRRGRKAELSHIGVLGISVRKGYRRMGIGEALIRRTLEERKAKFEVVTLEVFSNNTAAKRLYEKVGFKLYGRLPKAIKRGDEYVDGELMYITLKQS